MNPVTMVREAQEVFDAVPEPAEDAAPSDHLRYIGAQLARLLLSWKGVAVIVAVETVAIAIEVIG